MANGGSECTAKGAYNSSIQDWSDNSGTAIGPGDRVGRNGTYNRNLLSGRAADIIKAHDASAPLYMYLAFQDVHEGCARPDKLGVQAPLATVELYNTTVLDVYKIHGAMLTELDYGVAEVVAALKAQGMWENTVLAFYSDNGGPLDHSTNFPLRGGKHTFFVRFDANHTCAPYNHAPKNTNPNPQPLHLLNPNQTGRRAARRGVPCGRRATSGVSRHHVVGHGALLGLVRHPCGGRCRRAHRPRHHGWPPPR